MSENNDDNNTASPETRAAYSPDLRAMESNPSSGRGFTDAKDREYLDPESRKAAKNYRDQQNTTNESLYNPNEKGGFRNRSKSAFNRARKNKLLIGGAIAGGGGTIIVILLLVLLAGSLKIPNLATHIAEYQFARVLRQAVLSEQAITEERMAVDAVEDSRFTAIKSKYQGLRNNTWGKFDKYRPEKVVSNMQGKGQISIHTEPSKVLGRPQLKGITVREELFEVKKQGGSRFVPVLKDVVKFKNDTSFSKTMAPRLSTALKSNNIGPITRGRVAKQIRKELGISLVAWHVGKYKGKSDEQARVVQEREAMAAIADEEVGHTVNPGLEETAREAKHTEIERLAKEEAVKEMYQASGLDETMLEVIDKGTSPTIFKTAVGALNPSFTAALALCTIYDGSLTSSGPEINSRTESQQKSFYMLASAADQQKSGHTTGEAVGALNNKLGDVTVSNPEIRASQGKADTSVATSSQASPLGDFNEGSLSIIGAIFGDNAITKLDPAFETTCKTLLNPYVAVGGAVAGVALDVVLGVVTAPAGGEGAGATIAAEVAVDAAIAGATDVIVNRSVSRIIQSGATRGAGHLTGAQLEKVTAKSLSGKMTRILANSARDIVSKKNVAITGATLGSTFLAKLIVLNKMHSMTTGLEQGADFANEADSGGNINAQAVMQREFYGRPLTKNEAADNNEADIAFVKDMNQSKPTYDRYFAISNPNSMINKLAFSTASTFGSHKSILAIPNSVANSFAGLVHSFSSLLMPRSFATDAVNSSNTFYGNVQFGYSGQEQYLIKNDPSYRPLENQEILDSSDKETAIEEKYGECFSGKKKIGDLLAERDIVRSEDGDVIENEGRCSPGNLGLANGEFGTHMIFRWRLSKNYSNALDLLNDKQELVDGGGGASTITFQNSEIKTTVKIKTPGKFITMPAKYSCPGHTTQIDSRIAADVAYLATTFNMCVNDGLANGHNSHGAGLAVDMTPKNGNSKEDWKNSTEAAARAIGWYGDSAAEGKGSTPSCANYDSGYGQCMHAVYPDKFPQWLRWMGYNGAVDHGDPWHIYGGAGPHIHIGWDTPNGDGVSPTIISSPRQSVYAFPAPVPPDLESLIN